MPDPATIDELLRHIGLSERPAPDDDGLHTVHRAFLTHLAYDGITAQLGEHAPLAPAALIERTLSTGRGGYCFEINTILLTLLEALGFTMERRQGIVGPRSAFAEGQPTNHLALVATTAAGDRYICDAGWGEGPLDPMPLTAGTVAAGPLAWTIETEDGGAWWVGQHAWGSSPGFRFAAASAPLDAFAPHHERLASAPDSSFVTTLVIQQPTDDHIVTLRSRTLSRKGPDRDERTVLPDRDALASTLRDVFAIDPEALGADRVARLWGQACAQHEAFVSSTERGPAHRRSGSA
ncbi:arylamine N-acetyltransferase family protein [Baekduia sp.]|jgi:N-hydroxyarylamine O-acetyltransferase|uniref:arylamine N-acetyltransferase family protein n=1 Tax=Baekduia sp. TaxID=2600305 RepID=UPI002E080BF2|nr:arylamine N-acetyltransferase [Baekduia sp.]